MATLVSLNVGLPKDVEWRGRQVYTGAWKEPVAGARMVRRLNVVGDGQGDLGGHGGEHRAVLVYQLQSYRYWAAELNRTDLAPGHFGENFTVDGLSDDDVCIGDRYRIGDAVFEVTQPRVTCYRVGMRLDVSDMAALLVAHRRPGFYLRVLTEGEVAAGQEIVKVGDGPEGVTVAEVDALLYLPGHPRDGLARALRVPALSPGWKASLEQLLAQADSGAAHGGNSGLAASSPPPAWSGFRPLVVTAVAAESAHVKSLSLAAPDGVSLPNWLPGQSIAVRLGTEDGTVLRNYSLSNPPRSGAYRIGVKLESRGRGSGFLHSAVAVGDTIEVAAPRGTFFLAPGGDRPVVLLSAGVGVTPVLSMLHQLADTDADREVWWLHGARDGAEHPFAAECRDVVSRMPNAHVHVWYSQPRAVDRLGTDYTAAGRLSAETLAALRLPPAADAYLCGPTDFMTVLSEALAAQGLEPARIHSETFGAAAALTPGIAATSAAPPHPPPGPPGSGPEVSFARSGLAVRWAPRFGNVLELAEACDVPTRWSCRTGVCHNCETALLSGAVHYDPEPLDPPAEGNVLICCATPVGDVVVDL